MNIPWSKIIGERCWHVSVGEVTLPSFILVLGEKLPRKRMLNNEYQPVVYKKNRGSVELLVWCSWRLQTAEQVLATSDQGKEGVAELKRLEKAVVDNVVCYPPAWDLNIGFADDRILAIFCDHNDPGASCSQNWELWLPDTVISAGPGTELTRDELSQRL